MSGAVDEFERDPWEGEMDEYGNEELRISADDGMAYTKLEFIAYFGGTSEWDESEIVSQDLVMPEEEAAVITAEREDAAVHEHSTDTESEHEKFIENDRYDKSYDGDSIEQDKIDGLLV